MIDATANGRYAPAISLWRIPRTRSLLLLGIVGAIGGAILLAATLYTDLLWFYEIDQADVFWTTLKWKVLSGAFVGLGTASFVLLNLAAVERAMAGAGASPDDGSVAALIWRNRGLLAPAVSVACGVLALELRSAGTWQLLLLWSKRSDFGVDDPLFHHDVGFFVFALPLYREVNTWLLETVALGAGVALAAYAAAGAFRTGGHCARRAARAHLLALAAALLVVLAWRLRLDQFALALPHDPVAPGATYVDESVRLPALRALRTLALLSAGVCLYACVRRRVPRVAVGALALLALLALVAKGELPAAVQRFSVQPQALTRERPHIARAIEFTRRAYGLDRVSVRELPADAPLTRADVAEQRRTVRNVALWDPEVLGPAMNELQSIGGYYSFPSVTVDRYTVDGEPQVMTLGARQLALDRLAPGDRSWANVHFAYTHGYGVAGVRGAESDRGHYPRFAEQQFSARTGPVAVQEPRVYYGEQPDSRPAYVVVNTGRAEVDAPVSGDSSPSYHYHGDGGIALSDPLRRLAFAARFRDLDLLLTETVGSGSRILLHRNVLDRLRTVAPFLHWDSQPQTAIVGGRVQFLFDGYTTSDSYPYSAPVRMGRDEVNYVRADARAMVDSFSGRVSIYADSGDPILRAWEAVYPALFRPYSEMPADMRAHLRYPQQLFEAQADAYQTYHAEDATSFWNGSDAWARARQLAGPVERVGRIRFPSRRGEPMAPSYMLARLPGDAHERFILATPFTPRAGQNLVSYLAGSLGADMRPELTLLSLPRDRLTLGPTQATRRVLSSSGVVRRLELLNRESTDLGDAAVSRTTLGAPRLVPVAGTLLHVQPLFLSAGGQGVPRLQLVTAFANGRVGYGRTLAGALRRLLRTGACSPPTAAAERCQQQRQLAPLGDEDVDGDGPEDDREGEPGEDAG